MPALCTIGQVKRAQPVIGHDDDDDLLLMLIDAASEAVIGYLDTRAAEVIGLTTDGELESDAEIPAAVKVATVLTVRHLYEGPNDMQARPGGIPHRAEMLLYRLADPPLVGLTSGSGS